MSHLTFSFAISSWPQDEQLPLSTPQVRMTNPTVLSAGTPWEVDGKKRSVSQEFFCRQNLGKRENMKSMPEK